MLKYLDPLLVSLGLAAAGYGAYLVWEPLGFLLIGAALFWMGLPD
jgi:hypothetical protein